MKKIEFKCKLLSDLIITQSKGTVGNQQTLDFIPGNAFLGMVAGKLYRSLSAEESMLLFHSRKVKFGDAHPFINRSRCMRVPASWYTQKGEQPTDGIYLHHFLPEKPVDADGNPLQPKQQRKGFICGGNGVFTMYQPETNFAIKSAYDAKQRRAKDAQMFGFESLAAGSEWHFEIHFDEIKEELIQKVLGALNGKTSIGRSSTAQYGLVEITEIESNTDDINYTEADFRDGELLIYAESRLIFMDEFGQPTFMPEACGFGLNSGKIDWEKSQVRTFQYAPFNGKRVSRDSDRCGIEKGSAFYLTGVERDDIEKLKSGNFIGAYQNEGFGKILINPDFLFTTNSQNDGKADFEIISTKDKIELSQTAHEKPVIKNDVDNLVHQFLSDAKRQQDNQKEMFEKVAEFINNNDRFYKGDTFASQWGTIRKMAMSAHDKDRLANAIFNETTGYLKHGVAKEKWAGKKITALKAFVESLSDETSINTVINLAAEMAKKCKED